MSIATSSDIAPAPAPPLVKPLMLATGCVALADWLFYGWDVGISLALFLAALGIAGVAGNGAHANSKTRTVMTAIFVAGLLALIEDVSFLSVLLCSLTTALFVLAMTAPAATSWQRQLFEAATVPFRGPFRFAGDLFAALMHMKAWTPGWLGWLVGWIVPLSIFALFLGLISSANPLIEHRLMQIDPLVLFRHFELSRILFWLLIVCIVWPLIHRRIMPRRVRQAGQSVAAALPAGPDYLLGVQAMSRSLVLFNALFALQSGLDLTYLWGGASLPNGMTYAQYAHRGTNPLIVTALLAAGFVLIAMRPGGPAEQSRLIRPLVLAWIGQNILLVISSIFRLDLYVAAYSLTHLRLAAFIWMGLVAAGLVLVLVQIKLRKPNSWLISANAVSLALVLYACCFVNAPRLIASYNVEHSRENGGTGPRLDLRYLASLGPQALPPVEGHVNKIPVLWPIARDFRRHYESRRHAADWRGWDFRTWRLDRYLANNPDLTQQPLDGDKG
ncbi:MAG: DUF4173 domain-containing protein [Pseudomonadota bacterium]